MNAGNVEPRILGIIPARGGSKRLPRKNILPLNGKPLIVYAIESAIKALLLDRVIVSTDDPEIANVSKQHGADVPFLRPKELAEDTTGDSPVFKHAVKFLEDQGERFDYILNLRPTSPFRESADIDNIIGVAKDGKFNLVRSVTLAEGVAHPYWMYKIGGKDTLEPIYPTHSVAQYYQGQLLPKTFFQLNGVVDILSRDQVMSAPSMYMSDRMGYIEIPRHRAVDIDDKTDFEIAEVLMRNQ
ncbi:MAG: acylneuraminate cytidylyltransferase family protein [Candidatus Vogelbacteria bacterium]|nr:acylneuraminate cytidylyltransferase family protein [Candidatus Vogelbacteria bacterium]